MRFLILAAAVLSLAIPAHAASRAIAITHVTVVDVAGGGVTRDVTVLIRDGRIASVGHEAAPANATIVDGRGKFLIPGLWDMHVHLSWTTSSALPILVANGVTSVRDLGSKFTEIEDWRSRVAAGVMTGPRILRVGPILNGKSFNQYQLVPGNPDQTRGVARALKEVGVDFFKVHRRMERESYFALIDEAKKLGIPVVGHIPITVTPEEASNAGQQTIEHVATLFEGTFSAAHPDHLSEAMKAFREHGAEELFATFVKNHTAFDPTLSAYWALVQYYDPATKPDPRTRYVAASMIKAGAAREKPIVTPAELAEQKAIFEEYREYVRMANRAGVVIVTGSDIAAERVPGFTMHDELALLVDSGLTPMQALQAATINPATVTNRSKDLGSIEPGKLADLVLLRADPLADIHNTSKIEAVMVNGKLLRRAALDALLREGERAAAGN
jgi:imidazolonepropionase-like amidohydrolase